MALTKKKREIEKQVQEFKSKSEEINNDIANLKMGKSIMSYLESIDVQLVEVHNMYLLSSRKMVHKYEISDEYGNSFSELMNRVQRDNLTMLAPPMVLFHSAEFSELGLDMEFAIPVKEYVVGTRDFSPRLCIKSTLYGSYADISSVYIKQCEWAEKEGYESSNALYEVYVTDPSQVENESDLVTEVYYPVKKKRGIK